MLRIHYNIDLLMLYRKVIDVNHEKHVEHKNLHGVENLVFYVKTDGTYVTIVL